MSKSKTIDDLRYGDVIRLNLYPTEDGEQASYRLAAILSHPVKQNKILSGRVSVAPIAKAAREFPLHVDLDLRTTTQGSILMEYMRMIDLGSYEYEYIESLPVDKMYECGNIFEGIYEEMLTMD